MLNKTRPAKAHRSVVASVIVVTSAAVVVVTERIRACSVSTSVGTNAATASTKVVTPGGLLELLVPGTASSRLFVNAAKANVLMITPFVGSLIFRSGQTTLTLQDLETELNGKGVATSTLCKL